MSTIKQKSVFVELEDGTRVEVRRMKWKSLRDLLRKLGGAVIAFVQSQQVPTTADGAPPTVLTLSTESIQQILVQSDELVTHLCVNSSKFTIDEFDELDALSASRVVKAAIEVNMDDELKNCWAGIAQHVAGLMPAKAKTT